MTSYGFKLFEFRAYRDLTRAVIDFSDANGTHYVKRARDLLKSAQTTTFVGPPPIAATQTAGAANNTGRQLLKIRGLRTAGECLFGELSAAKVGSIPNAFGIPGTSADIPLKDHAPGREFGRFVLLFPPGTGVGLAAVEKIGNTCPKSALQYALTQLSKRTVTVAPDGSSSPYYRVKMEPLTDPAHLEKIVKANNAAEIRLIKRGPGASRGRDRKEIELFAAAVSPKKVSGVVGLLQQWQKDKKKGSTVSAAAGAAALASVAGGQSLADLDFDEGSLTIDDNGQPKMVTPALLEEVFTYPLSKRLSDKDWFHAVSSQANTSVQGTQVAVSWPAWASLRLV